MFKRFSDLLRGLFRSAATGPDPAAAARAGLLEKKVLALVDSLPTLPDAATKAVALVDDPNAKFSDLARLIETDAAIATGLLRVANSALYSAGSSVTKLDQALSRLGLSTAKNLIVSIAVQSMFKGIKGDARTWCEMLWRHGDTTAGIARHLNQTFRLGFKGEEYSAGLLHDLGRVLIALADPVAFAEADPMDFREDGRLVDRERSVLGIDHAALGGIFAEHTNLPADLVRAIRYHHDVAAAGADDRLVALTATADHLANHLIRMESPAAYDVEANAGLTALWASWPQTRRDRFRTELPIILQASPATAEAA